MKTGYILLLVLLLAACSNEVELTDSTRLYPVCFSLPDITGMTRAAASEGETTLPNDSTLTIAAYNPNDKSFVTQKNYKVVNNALVALASGNSTEMYLAAGTYDFCAIVPAQKLTENGTRGKIAPGVDALGSNTRALVNAENKKVTLNTLQHLASQISFTVRVVKENSPITTFKVVKVEIENMVTYTDGEGALVNNYLLPENKLIIPTTGETERYASIVMENTEDNPTFTYSATAPGGKNGKHYSSQKTPLIVYPRAAMPFKAKITVNMAENGGEVSPKEIETKIKSLVLEPGKRYLFEVNYGWDIVNFKLTVSNWTSIDNEQTEVGGGEQSVGTTFDVDEWGNLTETLGGDMGGSSTDATTTTE